MFFDVSIQEDRCRWSNYKLNCKKKKKISNVFRSKQTTNKVPLNIFKGWKKEKRYDWCFEVQKLAGKVNLRFLAVINKEYLEQQNSYGQCIFKLKYQNNGRNNIFREKQRTNKVSLMFLDVKVLTER